MALALTGGAAKAQLFSDNQLGGAVLGGVLGGVVGHNNNRKTAEGIGIGAGLGYLLGTLNDYDSGPRYSTGHTRVSVGYGSGYRYGHWGRRGWGHHRHFGRRHFGPGWGVTYTSYSPAVVYSTPAYVAPARTSVTRTYTRPNYAVGGAAVGGVLGAVIGHNSDRRTAEGAAIGAGAGLLLGGLAEHETRKRERQAAAAVIRAENQATLAERSRSTSLYAPGVVSGRTSVVEETTASQAATPTHAPANYSSMTSANRLFGR